MHANPTVAKKAHVACFKNHAIEGLYGHSLSMLM
jgi:hypothetical protein